MVQTQDPQVAKTHGIVSIHDSLVVLFSDGCSTVCIVVPVLSFNLCCEA